MNLDKIKQQLIDAEILVKNLTKQLENTLTVNRGDLILSKLDNRYYRVDYKTLDKDKNPIVRLKEIKNYEVNWQSCSIKSPKIGEFEIVDWNFDKKRRAELTDNYYESDSVSERKILEEELEGMFMNCYHDWRYKDIYTCDHCGAITKKTIIKDWLNGEKEVYNIDIEATKAGWI